MSKLIQTECIQKILSLQYRLDKHTEQAMFPFNTAPPAQNWAPAPIYYPTNVNPYEDETFLNEIFNFNQQSIAAFETLGHQVKLQFFLNVQEMKLLGYMTDKNNYQNILQQIARRKLILQKPTPIPTINKTRKDSQEWGAKLQNLCQDHLKKMQRDNFLDDIPIIHNPVPHVTTNEVDFLSGDSINSKKSVENQDDQFEWTQTKETINVTSNSSNGNHPDNMQPSPPVQYKTFEQLFVKKQVKTQQPAQKVQHIDVWDLQVLQQQPKSKLPSLKKTDSKPKQNQPFIYNKLYQLKQNQPFNNNNINTKLNGSGPDITDFDLEYFNIKPTNNNQPSNHSIDVNSDSSQGASRGNIGNVYVGKVDVIVGNVGNQDKYGEKQLKEQEIVSRNTQITNNNKQEEEFQWQEQDNTNKQQPVQHNNINHTSEQAKHTNMINNNSITDNTNILTYPTNNYPIDPPPNETPVNSSYIADSQLFNYNFLSSIPIIQPVQSVQVIQIVQPSNSVVYQSQTLPSANNNGNTNGNVFAFDTSFGLDLTGLDNQFNFNNTYTANQPNKYQVSQAYSDDINVMHKKGGVHEQYTVPQDDEDQEQPMIASTIIPTLDFSVLDQLKVSPSTKNISSALNKKIFDFDIHFYQEGLHLISVLGYQQNPDYDYIKEQNQICQEIIRLTELYTAAVDQDKEDEVRESLRKSKKLYLQLDTKKTATIIRKYLKIQGKSLSYQMGKLSLQAGVPKQLIQKAMQTKRFNQTVTLLYLMVFFGNTYSISLFACQVIQYVEHICGEMEQLLKDIGNMEQLVVNKIRSDAKFIQYRQNICKIMAVARRILELGSICVRDELSPNITKTNELISAIIPPPNNHQLLPNYFLTFFSNFACSTCNSIYTLHSQMQEFIDEHPLCSLCLEPIEETDNGGSKKDDNRFYHFKCWNFREAVVQYKKQLMIKLDAQLKQSQEQSEKVEQQKQ